MMSRAAIVQAAALALVLAGSSARAQSALPTISVSGEASIAVAPDRATIDGGVASEAKTARAAADANNKAMNDVLSALKGAGIAEADIQTSRLSLQPQTAQNKTPGGPIQIVGYRASNHVTVTLRDVSKVAGAIDTLVGAGANEISGISFSVSQASKLLDDARTQAIADARRKAEIYAKATDITLGPPVSITEDGVPGPVPMYARKMTVDAATPIAPGEETLHIRVSVAYEIRPR